MNFLDIILGTPWWVWILFGYLLIVGIKATKPNILPLWRIAVMPLIFVIWSIYSIYYKCIYCPKFFGIWFVALIFGILIGHLISMRLKSNIDSEKLIHMPGSLIPLLLSMMFFVLKYGLGVTYSLYPVMKGDLILLNFDLLLSGLISGIFCGRFSCVLYKYIKVINH